MGICTFEYSHLQQSNEFLCIFYVFLCIYQFKNNFETTVLPDVVDLFDSNSNLRLRLNASHMFPFSLHISQIYDGSIRKTSCTVPLRLTAEQSSSRSSSASNLLNILVRSLSHFVLANGGPNLCSTSARCAIHETSKKRTYRTNTHTHMLNLVCGKVLFWYAHVRVMLLLLLYRTYNIRIRMNIMRFVVVHTRTACRTRDHVMSAFARSPIYHTTLYTAIYQWR